MTIADTPKPALKALPRLAYAKLLGVSLATVDRWRRKHAVSWYRVGGSIFIFPPDEKQLSERRAQ